MVVLVEAVVDFVGGGRGGGASPGLGRRGENVAQASVGDGALPPLLLLLLLMLLMLMLLLMLLLRRGGAGGLGTRHRASLLGGGVFGPRLVGRRRAAVRGEAGQRKAAQAGRASW